MPSKDFINEYLAQGLLKKQETNSAAITKLLVRAGKDLEAAKANLTIDAGIAYMVAYLAMLRAARAFMLLKGFRPSDGQQHKTVVEFVAHYLGNELQSLIDHFDRLRRKRNIFTYEIDISISLTEAQNALDTAVKFVTAI